MQRRDFLVRTGLALGAGAFAEFGRTFAGSPGEVPTQAPSGFKDCFEVSGMKPQEAIERLLRRRIIASETPYATQYVRVAASVLNTPEEVDTALREIRALA